MRFVAYWDRCKQHCNIHIDDYIIVNDSVVELYRSEARVGMFDMGVLDIWYVSKGESA